FWHDHFATANSKVGNAVLMQAQMQLFRENGLGNFETLLQKVTRDPAMLIWLDNRQNRKGSPNENYAREVMELFTVGIGNYTEQDIHEAARAFTGHTLDKTQKYTFRRPEFLSSQAFHGQIKQPVDFVIGSLKSLNVQNVGPDVTQVLRRMGQDLLNPPDVSGWKGGPGWINSSTLFERFNWANKLS